MESKLDSHVEFAGVASDFFRPVSAQDREVESRGQGGGTTSKLAKSRTRYQFGVVLSCLLCIRLALSQALVAGSRFENSVCSRLPVCHKPNLRQSLYVRPTTKGRLSPS